MSHFRSLGATIALVAAGLVVLSSVALAHGGPHFGPNRFDNRWVGTPEADVFTAPEGSRDLIIGLGGNDRLLAGDRRDVIVGDRGDDAIDGGAGRDFIRGGLGDDRLAGGDQADKIFGGPGADGINGQAGHDVIDAGLGDDLIIADEGQADTIRCGPGSDRVRADRARPCRS